MLDSKTILLSFFSATLLGIILLVVLRRLPRERLVLVGLGTILVLGALLFALLGSLVPENPLRVGTNIWPGYEPLFLARSLGYYEGHAIRLIEFSSSAEVIRAYRNGLIDVAAVTADEALLISATQPNHRIVLVCDFSNGADVLLARPEFHSIQELKGKRVGAEATILGAYMLARALEHGGLAVSDVQVVEVPLLEHESAFLSGKVDAIVTFEPRRSRLMASGARVLFDSSQIPGEIVDVLLTRQDLTDGQTRELGVFVSGWFRALDYLQENPSDAALRVSPREQVTPQQFLDSLRLIELPDRDTNLGLLGKSPQNLSGGLDQLSALMLKNQIVSKKITLPILDDGFIQGVKP